MPYRNISLTVPYRTVLHDSISYSSPNTQLGGLRRAPGIEQKGRDPAATEMSETVHTLAVPLSIPRVHFPGKAPLQADAGFNPWTFGL